MKWKLLESDQTVLMSKLTSKQEKEAGGDRKAYNQLDGSNIVGAFHVLDTFYHVSFLEPSFLLQLVE